MNNTMRTKEKGTVKDYIEEHWPQTIRENRKDSGNVHDSKGELIGMPYPYSIPAVGYFDEMYYWDTYFTNKGLEISGRMLQAKNNTDNMLYLVDRFGFMPNGNRSSYLKNSQPPYLSLMVRDIYKFYHDPVWLRGAIPILEREYLFWMTKRKTECGLNCYSGSPSADLFAHLAQDYAFRSGNHPSKSERDIAMHYITTCESGWDTTPRWGEEAYNYACIDVNSLLYAMERNMAFFAQELKENADVWENRAEQRGKRMRDLMLDEKGIFCDYNFAEKQRSDLLSVAAFYPLFVEMATAEEAEALHMQLDRLEADYGVLTCEKREYLGTYQWDYPNGWACLQYIAIKALENYGFHKDARRLAKKYVSLVDRIFAETGNLWELEKEGTGGQR